MTPIQHVSYSLTTSTSLLDWISETQKDIKTKIFLEARGGVKLEFVRNSFDSIWKFAIWLIQKGKKYLKNSMKINSKFFRFDSTPTIGWTQIFQMLDSFEIRSIRFENLRFDWFERWKIIWKNSIKINSKFDRFDLTTPLVRSKACPVSFSVASLSQVRFCR